MDPIGWIRGVDAVLSGNGDEKAIEAVTPLKPVLCLLGETSRINGAWRVSSPARSPRLSEALASLPKVLNTIGDGRRVVMVVRP